MYSTNKSIYATIIFKIMTIVLNERNIMVLKTSQKTLLCVLVGACFCPQATPVSWNIQPNYGSLAAITAGAGTGLLAYTYLLKGLFANQGPSHHDIQDQIATLSRAVSKKTAEYTALQDQLKQATTAQDKKKVELQLKKYDAYFARAQAKIADLNDMLMAAHFSPSTSQSLASWTALCVCLGAGAYAGYRIHQFWETQQQSAPDITSIVTTTPIIQTQPEKTLNLDDIDTSGLQLLSDYNVGDTDLADFLDARDATQNITELLTPNVISPQEKYNILMRFKYEKKQAASAARSFGTLMPEPSGTDYLLSQFDDLTNNHLEYIAQSSQPLHWPSIDLEHDRVYGDVQNLAENLIQSQGLGIDCNDEINRHILHHDVPPMLSQLTVAEKLWKFFTRLLKQNAGTDFINQDKTPVFSDVLI